MTAKAGGLFVNSYVINLDRSPARSGRMYERFASIGLEFERIPAVDGKLLSEKRMSDVYQPVPGAVSLTKEEVGCFLSHRRCWEEIASGLEPFGSVFEDDVIISSHLPRFVGNDTSWIPVDADIVKLETVLGRVWLDRVVSMLPGDFRLSLLRSLHFGTGGYIISKAAAERLLKLTERFSDPVDHVMFNPACGVTRGLKTYQILPALCIQSFHLYPKGSDLVDSRALTQHSAVRFPDNLENMPWLKRKTISALRRTWRFLRRYWRTEIPFADDLNRA
ncbi:glycosyltransferase family 25 protein [Mesorhizobium sp. B263B1A]|uniref:glycosyltransferase family 25 protein n=1 Tax=Mesorhizobium sp. B263B1A TaxID=2876670 RepID=UPI0011276D51|nr:glycosyltransferase family 25 protein [Mesorhizobium sp. B263B1A]TPJ90396.1 glycosyltransferase family 25 protein [Mesorhizobium sp. B2-5-12]TPK20373.1 glycosyltransferase family 25 protein [Mesorhizobium sp. B2-5-6]